MKINRLYTCSGMKTLWKALVYLEILVHCPHDLLLHPPNLNPWPMLACTNFKMFIQIEGRRQTWKSLYHTWHGTTLAWSLLYCIYIDTEHLKLCMACPRQLSPPAHRLSYLCMWAYVHHVTLDIRLPHFYLRTLKSSWAWGRGCCYCIVCFWWLMVVLLCRRNCTAPSQRSRPSNSAEMHSPASQF